MKLSHKLEYACRVLAQLARRREPGGLAHIDELAEAESVPANYLVQILNELRNAGLITSKRGKQGGYALAMPPGRIGLDAIVRAVEPDLLEGNFGESGHSGARVAAVWAEIGTGFEEALRSHTLDAFVAEEAARMYHI